MALGDSRNSNNKIFENTYYSRTRFKNYDSKMILGFKFKSGMLVVDISQEKDGFQYETLIDIFITSTKAKILMKSIESFEEDLKDNTITPEKAYGITTGMGEIASILALHVNDKMEKCIFIGKVDASGKYTKSIDFVLNCNDFHYGLRWSNLSNMNVKKVYHNDLELEIFKDTISQFVDSSSGAFGYSVADITRYDYKAIMNKMNPIYDKLGIERTSNRSSSNSRGGYFMNPPESSHKSLEDIDEELPFE